MKAYLIDFENVKSKGLSGIDLLGENDRVIIFYSENSDTISFDMHRKVMSSSAQIEYLKVRVGGKNALDFQLSTLLGYLVAKEMYSHIFIISNDKGFDKLHDFWNTSFADSNSCIVFRTQTLAAAVNFVQHSSPVVTVEEHAAEEATEETAEAANAIEIFDSDEPSEEEDTEEVLVTPQAEIEIIGDDETVEESQQEMEEEQPVLTGESESIDDKTLPIEILNDEHELAWAMSAEESGLDEDVKVKKIPSRTKRGRPPKPAAVQIKNSLTGFFTLSSEEIECIKECIAASNSKEDFHNGLAKAFKQQGGELYKILRPKYLKLKESIANESTTAETAENHDDEVVTLPDLSEERSVVCSDAVYEYLKPILANECSDEEIRKTSEIVRRSDSKQKIYLSIVKEYKKDRGCEIYKLIKPEYSALAKLRETL